jgi:NAD(P)-dependent dehydrogenase (short-subunit alcohol dehydrogenase family)
MARLESKTAIVTGSAQGIGATYAEALAGEGARVVVVDIADPSPVIGTIERAGGQAIGIHADISDPDAVADMVRQSVSAFGQIDILVNNAAILSSLKMKPFEDITVEEWDALMRVNVRGTFQCAQAVVPDMRRRKYGKIINISSSVVMSGAPGFLHYVSAKGAVMAMTKALARELGDDNICVNTLAPGLVMSEAVERSPEWTPERRQRAINNRSIKRTQMPDDLVGALLFLASPDSDFVTGQTMVVDGGEVMH